MDEPIGIQGLGHFTPLKLPPIEIDMVAKQKYDFERRRHAWFTAKNMVEPIVELHGLEGFRVNGNLFQPGGRLISKVEQHCDCILEVADWLLGDDR